MFSFPKSCPELTTLLWWGGGNKQRHVKINRHNSSHHLQSNLTDLETIFYQDSQRHYTAPTLILTFSPESRIQSRVLLFFVGGGVIPAGEVVAVAAAAAEQSWGKRILTS